MTLKSLTASRAQQRIPIALVAITRQGNLLTFTQDAINKLEPWQAARLGQVVSRLSALSSADQQTEDGL
jgi:hypothetical protein